MSSSFLLRIAEALPAQQGTSPVNPVDITPERYILTFSTKVGKNDHGEKITLDYTDPDMFYTGSTIKNSTFNDGRPGANLAWDTYYCVFSTGAGKRGVYYTKLTPDGRPSDPQEIQGDTGVSLEDFKKSSSYTLGSGHDPLRYKQVGGQALTWFVDCTSTDGGQLPQPGTREVLSNPKSVPHGQMPLNLFDHKYDNASYRVSDANGTGLLLVNGSPDSPEVAKRLAKLLSAPDAAQGASAEGQVAPADQDKGDFKPQGAPDADSRFKSAQDDTTSEKSLRTQSEIHKSLADVSKTLGNKDGEKKHSDASKQYGHAADLAKNASIQRVLIRAFGA